eukprot:superscaffoldBa00001182_g9378
MGEIFLSSTIKLDCHTDSPIKTSLSLPGESQTFLSSRSPPEFIRDLSEAFALAVRKGGGWWRRWGGEGGVMSAERAVCLLIKLHRHHRPAEAPAIKAVAPSVDRARREFCLVNLQ